MADLDKETRELVAQLILKLGLKYGSIEIKIHDGKFSHIVVSKRINANDKEL